MSLHPDADRKDLWNAYVEVRKTTEKLCSPLQTEDYVIQSMDDVSPPKWHLGHTTWFFETFLLSKYSRNYQPFHPGYGFLFNSYYESVGQRVARQKRGLCSRPTVKEVYAYRSSIDGRMAELTQTIASGDWNEYSFLINLGLNHEQQHQELLITDIKHILAANPLRPVYCKARPTIKKGDMTPHRFLEFEGGIFEIGFQGPFFSFDNERPRHRVLLNDYCLQNRVVTNGEFLEFIQDGGYSDFRHWLSEGWAAVDQGRWKAPLYWEEKDNEWFTMTLSGIQKLDPDEPACHVSYFEADAFARWAGKRLATEEEWEHAAEISRADHSIGNFMGSERFHPVADYVSRDGLQQLFGDVWEWTTSAYLPYPGFHPETGDIGEYNGKFMSNQMVLRGGSCATPANHIRATYRNFFQTDKRWQFSGIRLASDAGK